jgi:vitamin B12 transport system permease protein
MSVRTLAGAVFALACAIMLGLAAGAIWMVAAVSLGSVAAWLALPAAWLLAAAMRHWVCPRHRAGAALLAAAATALAATYLNVLVAAARIAGSMGIGLLDALRTAGPAMLLELARLGLSAGSALWFAIGVVLAALLGARASRPATTGRGNGAP